MRNVVRGVLEEALGFRSFLLVFTIAIPIRRYIFFPFESSSPMYVESVGKRTERGIDVGSHRVACYRTVDTCAMKEVYRKWLIQDGRRLVATEEAI